MGPGAIGSESLSHCAGRNSRTEHYLCPWANLESCVVLSHKVSTTLYHYYGQRMQLKEAAAAPASTLYCQSLRPIRVLLHIERTIPKLTTLGNSTCVVHCYKYLHSCYWEAAG
jgi:hypothetical protein